MTLRIFLSLTPPDSPFGPRFCADFASQAPAAIFGAGIGAWLGAQFAFRLERRKAKEDRAAAARAAAKGLCGRPWSVLHGRMGRQVLRTIRRIRVLTHIKKLDDCFGLFLVRVSCPCGASRHIEPVALFAATPGS
jgi:hypothetical protein